MRFKHFQTLSSPLMLIHTDYVYIAVFELKVEKHILGFLFHLHTNTRITVRVAAFTIAKSAADGRRPA